MTRPRTLSPDLQVQKWSLRRASFATASQRALLGIGSGKDTVVLGADPRHVSTFGVGVQSSSVGEPNASAARRSGSDTGSAAPNGSWTRAYSKVAAEIATGSESARQQGGSVASSDGREPAEADPEAPGSAEAAADSPVAELSPEIAAGARAMQRAVNWRWGPACPCARPRVPAPRARATAHASRPPAAGARLTPLRALRRLPAPPHDQIPHAQLDR